MNIKITDSIKYIGVDDKDLDLFEGQYVVPNGVSYNSYLIKDEKIAVLDTVDSRATDTWLEKLDGELEGKKVDYLVVSHLEPDHSYNIKLLCEKYPDMKLIGNQKTFAFLPQFFNIDEFEKRKVLVNDGDEIVLGQHTLKFAMAPMVHWPEVMVTYEKKEKVLFSADAFGKFGTLDIAEEWESEARRYYFNIVGKYGIQVQALLNKATELEIKMICPLHGPILDKNIEYYVDMYNTWSQYIPEEDGILIVAASMHGNTFEAMKELKRMLIEKSDKEVKLIDLVREDLSEVISQAFKYKTLVLAAPTYNAELFPLMEHFLRELKGKGYKNRKIAFVENGTWAPMANKLMMDIVTQMKDMEVVMPQVTIRTKLNEETRQKLEELAEVL